MDRKRVADEVIEILANKLHNLPPLPVHPDDEEEPFDYEAQRLIPDVTENTLDIAEVSMDLEDAFGINFDEILPGGEGMETIGNVVDHIHRRVNAGRGAA